MSILSACCDSVSVMFVSPCFHPVARVYFLFASNDFALSVLERIC